MRCVNRLLAGVLIVPALTLTPAMAQEGASVGQSLSRGPMTAWCEPGQALLSGGYELQGAEPPAPSETTTDEAPPEPPVVFVASSRPTVRLDRNGDVAQFGWTAVPNTIAGNAGTTHCLRRVHRGTVCRAARGVDTASAKDFA